MIAAGDGVDVTDKSMLLLLTSNEIDESDVSFLSFTASSANLAKSKRFGSDATRWRFRTDDASSRDDEQMQGVQHVSEGEGLSKPTR